MGKMIEIKLTQSEAERLEQHVEEHMMYCLEELNGEEVPVGWSSFDPYCGCSTCESREYLMSTFNWLKENGIVDIYVESSGDSGENTLFD
jgi:hypothetical protein